MLENQFITINESAINIALLKNTFALPTWAHEYEPNPSRHIYMFIDGAFSQMSLVNEAGTAVYSATLTPSSSTYVVFNLTAFLYAAHQQGAISNNTTYLLRALRGTANYKYSRPIVFCAEADSFVVISYKCDQEALGFPFNGSNSVSMYLPIRLHSPQNTQDDKTYVKANGNVVTLFAKYYKEWEGETEYLTEEMHDKIVAALACDAVYISGKRVTKSDKYQVDWENYDMDCNGTTKLARATFKVRENTNQRNSNF